MAQPGGYGTYEYESQVQLKPVSTIESIIRDLERFRGLFPTLLTLVCFALFSSPVVTGLRLASDETVRYWIGWYPYFVLLAPAILVICHLLHLWYGRPRFILVVLSTIIPAGVLVFIGYTLFFNNGGIAEQLLSSDCTTYDSKYRIEEAYRSARDLYDTCVSRFAEESGLSVHAAAERHTIEDCPDYRNSPESATFWREWEYLRHLETSQECAGWCYEEEVALWTSNAQPKDVCSKDAGVIIDGKVRRNAARMFYTSLLDLLVSVVAISLIQEVFNVYNLDW